MDNQGGDYRDVIRRLQQLITEETGGRTLTGVSIALVDDQSLVYAEGFGWADETRRIAARADTIYRVGSVSKLFNAIAVMQLVEQGLLDLDQPISTYDAAFSIVSPFADPGPVTLRQLLCHRSGMVRESPVGSYFDSSNPTIEATLRSVASCVLVNRPGAQTRYSNVGPTLAGHIVSRITGLAYEEYQQRHILGPLGMSRSSFMRDSRFADSLARGYMQVSRPGGTFGRQEAPVFELGTMPAGSLYATAPDVARLAMLLFADGLSGDGQIIRSEALKEMLRPQLVDEPVGFGLGFNISRLGTQAMASHNGAVYGFSSTFAALPGAKLAAVVLANEDLVLGPVRMIAESALEWMLEVKYGEQTPAAPAISTAPEQLARLVGEYESTSYWANLTIADGRLTAMLSGQPLALTASGPMKFMGQGRWQWRTEFAFAADDDGAVDEFQALGQTFRRVAPGSVRPPPPAWQAYLGSYGPPFIPLIVSIRNGNLYAFTENLCDYRLTPITRGVFGMPPGLYTDEYLVFHPGPDGVVHTATLAGVDLKKAPVSPSPG